MEKPLDLTFDILKIIILKPARREITPKLQVIETEITFGANIITVLLRVDKT